MSDEASGDLEIPDSAGAAATPRSRAVPASQPALPCRYVLANGQGVEFTFLSRADRADLLAGFEGLSRRSRYLRFFSAMPELPDFIADGLLRTDERNHVAIGARLLDGDGAPLAPIVGVARYFRTADDAEVAEPAIAVADSQHKLGLGKYLLRRLSAVARSRGITRFRAQVLAGNQRMRQLLTEAQAQFVDNDGDVLSYEIDIRKATPAPRGVLARLLAVMQGGRGR